MDLPTPYLNVINPKIESNILADLPPPTPKFSGRLTAAGEYYVIVFSKFQSRLPEFTMIISGYPSLKTPLSPLFRVLFRPKGPNIFTLCYTVILVGPPKFWGIWAFTPFPPPLVSRPFETMGDKARGHPLLTTHPFDGKRSNVTSFSFQNALNCSKIY